ncbi:MAG: hypothetical protein WAU11_12095 [Ignavibacteriaceae bacterium]
MNKRTAIVIGCYVSGIGVIRSLANKNIRIIALSYEEVDFAHKSKYVSEWHRIHHPLKDENSFIKFLLDKAAIWKDAVIFDTDDNIATTLSKNKQLLSRHYKIVTANYDQMSMFINKDKAWKLALENDIPHPANYRPVSREDFDSIRSHIKLPCLFKPVKGHEFRSVFNVKNFVVNTFDEYDKYLNQCLEKDQQVMVQEIIPGPDTLLYKCMTYINSNGESAGYFFYNKLRQNPPGFGVIRVCKSAPYNEEVAILFDKILKSSGYKGFITVEFKKDTRDNKLKFIEANVRMPRNNQLPFSCGVNFPWIIFSDLNNKLLEKFTSYNDKKYWIELYSDLLNSIFRHSKENYSIKEYLAPYLSRNKTFAVLSFKDPLPFIYQTFKMLRFIKSV